MFIIKIWDKDLRGKTNTQHHLSYRNEAMATMEERTAFAKLEALKEIRLGIVPIIHTSMTFHNFRKFVIKMLYFSMPN